MKLPGKISIRIDQDVTTIEINDPKSGTTFVTVTLTPEQLSKALSRLSKTDCEIDVRNTDRIGLTLETKTFDFIIPDDITTSMTGRLGDISQTIVDVLNEGWISDRSFGSQNSFFIMNNNRYARVICRRWV